jgi:hypothetical protein
VYSNKHKFDILAGANFEYAVTSNLAATDPRTFTYEDSPYAYRDQFLTCQRSFLESRVESEFSHSSRNESYGMGIKIK